VFVDALIALRRTHPDLPLRVRIAGGGDEQYSAQLRQRVADAGLQDAVEFVGELDVNGLSDLLGRRIGVGGAVDLVREPAERRAGELRVRHPGAGLDHGALTECVVTGRSVSGFRRVMSTPWRSG